MMQDDKLRAEVQAWRRREVQAIGAAISLQSWHGVERAYNALRDKMDALPRAALAETRPSSEDAVERVAVREQISELLGSDPVCNGRVCTGTIDAIAALAAAPPVPDERMRATEVERLLLEMHDDAAAGGERSRLLWSALKSFRAALPHD